MKTLSIKEPHATLLLTPYKTIETRSWATTYRGPILLHASMAIPSYKSDRAMWDRVLKLYDKEETRTGTRPKFRNGYIYAKTILADCIEMTEENIKTLSQEEIDAGYYAPGRYMWILKNIEPLPEPIKCKGHLGLWEYNHEEANA